MEKILTKLNFKTDKKNIALLLLIAASVSYILYSTLFAGLLQKMAWQETRMQELKQQITLYENFASRHKDYEQFITQKDIKLQALEKKFAAESDTGEEMQKYYQLADKYQIDISEMKLLPQEVKNDLTVQSLHLVMQGNFFDMLKILDQIENSARFVTVNKIHISGNSETGTVTLSAIISWYIAS